MRAETKPGGETAGRPNWWDDAVRRSFFSGPVRAARTAGPFRALEGLSRRYEALRELVGREAPDLLERHDMTQGGCNDDGR